MRPMKPRRRPLPEAVKLKRSWVMKGRENSMPEKKRMKARWVMLRMRWELVRFTGFADFVSLALPVVVPLAFGLALGAGATMAGSVSGRYR